MVWCLGGFELVACDLLILFFDFLLFGLNCTVCFAYDLWYLYWFEAWWVCWCWFVWCFVVLF